MVRLISLLVLIGFISQCGTISKNCSLEYYNFLDRGDSISIGELSFMDAADFDSKDSLIIDSSYFLNYYPITSQPLRNKLGFLLNKIDHIESDDTLHQRLTKDVELYFKGSINYDNIRSYYFLADFGDEDLNYIAKKLYMVNVFDKMNVRSIVCVSDILSILGENNVTGHTEFDGNYFRRYFYLEKISDTVPKRKSNEDEKFRYTKFKISKDGIIEIIDCN